MSMKIIGKERLNNNNWGRGKKKKRNRIVNRKGRQFLIGSGTGQQLENGRRRLQTTTIGLIFCNSASFGISYTGKGQAN
jgi:hypothetical protein